MKTFAIGDKVLLSTENLNLPQYKEHSKFKPKYIRPFRVLNAQSNVYTLELPPTSKLKYNKFHVSLIRPFYEDQAHSNEDEDTTPVEIDGEVEYVIEAIIKHKIAYGDYQYLVKWAGYDETSWLPSSQLLHAQDLITDYWNEYNRNVRRSGRVQFKL